MKRRMFIYTTSVLCAGLLCFFAASVYVTYTNNLNLAKDMVMETAQICAVLYHEGADISALGQTGGGTRITVIASDGTVLADSRPLDVGMVENHLSRPEIQAAQRGFPEPYVRHSDTLGVDLIYYALKTDSADGPIFIRVAIPVAKIDTYLLHSLPLLVLLLIISALLCAIFTGRSVGRIVAPLGSVGQKLRLLLRGEYKPEPVAGNYEEIEAITREIDGVATLLQSAFSTLYSEKSKLDYILNNIGDGLFAIDESRSVALINAAALGIFNVTSEIVGKNLTYLTYDKIISGAVEDCILSGKNAIFEWARGGSIYLVTIKPLPDTMLTMVILSNVTESRENLRRREEFFANASHELKTPLTAIKGFNELTALNNRDEAIRRYIESIARETDRMLALIGNMLELSELENTQSPNPEPISLAKTIGEVYEALSTSIGEKSITFEVVGDGMVVAEPEHIYELVKNLIENAVRYNNPGGSVFVTVENSRRTTRLTIADNGIGIPPEEQTRIFERFYRVEKSRSRRGGGTGLGLSIVKHICALYGWKISLKSKLGIGTEVAVVF